MLCIYDVDRGWVRDRLLLVDSKNAVPGSPVFGASFLLSLPRLTNHPGTRGKQRQQGTQAGTLDWHRKYLRPVKIFQRWHRNWGLGVGLGNYQRKPYLKPNP